MPGSMTFQEQLQSGMSHHQAGRLAQARASYLEALSLDPSRPEPLDLLGVIAVQTGQFDEAIEWIRQAIAINPRVAGYHSHLGNALDGKGQRDQAIAAWRVAIGLDGSFAEAYANLGNALREKGQLKEAAEACRQAVRLDPNSVVALNNLGAALQAPEQLDEAIAAYRAALRINPDLPETHNNLGNALLAKRQLDEAIAEFQQAVRLKPDSADIHRNLGSALYEKGRLDEAIAAHRQAIRLQPDYADAYNNLGLALTEKGDLDEAITACRQAIRLKPDLAEAHNSLGNALGNKRQLDEAVASYRQAIRLKPDLAEAHYNLGNALTDKGQLDEAVASFRQAIRLKPDFAGAHCNLGNALKDKGQLDQAIASYRQAIWIKPDFAGAHGNLTLALHYDPGYDAKMIYEELCRWNQQHAEPLKKLILPHANNRDPGRRLRIGYVSPDFRECVVAPSLLPLLREHDHRQMEIFCYANVLRPDARTEQLRRYADVWRSIVGLSDSQTADLIRQDRIDVLVDLALQAANNRLLVFAQKPAPVQVTYLAYPSSSGMTTMDYRLSDPYLDPPGGDESVYSEQTIRLPETYWCYSIARPAPEPSPLPAVAAGYVTFGCLNNFVKVSPPALDLWADILRAVPRSRLILHSNPGAHLDTVWERFAGKGISPDRLEFYLEWGNWPKYLQTYGRIDIALDPFPWGGGITTCDALWMGVPVVSLVGRTAVGRAGLSILSNVGLPDLVASTPDEYMRLAVRLANDLPRLKDLHATLRQRMQASPLMDAPRFARNIEVAYRQMWRNWCAQPGNSSRGSFSLPKAHG